MLQSIALELADYHDTARPSPAAGRSWTACLPWQCEVVKHAVLQLLLLLLVLVFVAELLLVVWCGGAGFSGVCS
jgi:hypothetical protein